MMFCNRCAAPGPVTAAMQRALDAVIAERHRQAPLRVDGQRHDTSEDPALKHAQHFANLTAALCEVALLVSNVDDLMFDQQCLYQELIQVAALAIAWMEELDPCCG